MLRFTTNFFIRQHPFVRSFSLAATKNATNEGALGAKLKLKKGAAMTKVELDVETDTNKLVNYVCGLNYVNDSEMVPIKKDSEYPEWIFKVHTGPPIPVWELEPNSREYWKQMKEAAIEREKRIAKATALSLY